MSDLNPWSAKDVSTVWGSNERKLVVEGNGEVTNTNQKLVLYEAESPGIDPTTLILDLKVEEDGIGNTVVLPKNVETFEKAIKQGQYKKVMVRRGSAPELVLDVQVLIS